MRCKGSRSKQYHIDSRNSTTKKAKRVKNNSDRHTPHSHSTSHNYHKYQRQVPIEGDQLLTHKKIPLKTKQMRMMIRTLQLYCSNMGQCTCQQIAKRYQVSAKIFQHLNQQYKVVGNQREIFKNQKLLQQLHASPKESLCKYCEELGVRCDQWQRQLIRKELSQDVEKLEDQLLEEFKRKEDLQKMIEMKNKCQSRQSELENLRKIESIQKEFLKQLYNSDSDEEEQMQLDQATKPLKKQQRHVKFQQ